MNVLIIENSDLLIVRYKGIISSIININLFSFLPYSSNLFSVIKNQLPEIVIITQELDINIKLELIKKIKSYNPITKIISLCSKSFPEINKQYKIHGVDHCLDKATEFNQLIEIIENYKPTIAN